MTFNEKFEKLRRDKGLTIRDIASTLKAGVGTVQGWGKATIPHPETVRQLADFFGVTIQQLLDDKIDLPASFPLVLHEDAAIYSSSPKINSLLKRLDIIEKECRNLRSDLSKLVLK